LREMKLSRDGNIQGETGKEPVAFSGSQGDWRKGGRESLTGEVFGPVLLGRLGGMWRVVGGMGGTVSF